VKYWGKNKIRIVMIRFTTFFLLLFCLFLVPLSVQAGNTSFTQQDRELLIRLDERLNQVDKRFEQIDKRFEQIDKRFEQVDKRFAELREDMNKRFETMQDLMIAIIGAFAAVVAVTIGFAIWDRRTMIRPFEREVREINDSILQDRKRLETMLEALRRKAATDQELASILKNFSLM